MRFKFGQSIITTDTILYNLLLIYLFLFYITLYTFKNEKHINILIALLVHIYTGVVAVEEERKDSKGFVSIDFESEDKPPPPPLQPP